MGIKSWKINALPERLNEKTLSMLLLDEIALKSVKKKIMIDRGKGRTILKEGRPVGNINKNPQSYRIINIQKRLPLSHKL